MYYNRQGESIKLDDWMKFKEDKDYRSVGRDIITLDDTDVLVSTVWTGLGIEGLGIESSSNICIFETMVFGGEYDRTEYHYKTEEEAIKGHQEAVKLVSSTVNTDPMKA